MSAELRLYRHKLTWHKWVVLSVALGMLLLMPNLVAAQNNSNSPEVAHVVLEVEGTVGVSRDGWNVLSQTAVVPGMALRASDYLIFSGASQVKVLCADLSIQEVFSDGVVKCTSNPSHPAFYYVDMLDWLPDTNTVTTTAETVLPDEVSEAIELETLSSADTATLNSQRATIEALNLDDDIEAYVLASLYARYGLYYDAITTVSAHEDLQCKDVALVRSLGASAMLESPTVYLRLGEWYYFVDDLANSEQMLTCSQQLATSNNDIGHVALASARLGDITTDGNPFTFYQQAIDSFAQLQANNAVDNLLQTCGSRNCSDPR